MADDDDQPPSVGACHKADVVPACSGPAPARLGTQQLMAGFLAEVSAKVGLTGVYGRRVAFGDVNGDGFPDIATVQSGVTPGLQHLFIYQPGTNTYADVTASSGIQAKRGGGVQTALMVAFGDVDNDGDLDLFSGSYSQDPLGQPNYVADPNELYLNDGAGKFTLATGSGLNARWPLTTAAAVFLDYDKDGKLDLFVGNFMIDYPYLDSYQDDLWRGNGDGTFTNVNAAARIETTAAVGDPSGMYRKPTYGATACDVDSDGWQDILVSVYALGWDDHWRNRGDGTFSWASKESGFWMDDQDNPNEQPYRDGGNTFAAACGDYDNDGDLDVFTAETTHGDYPRSTADRSRILVNDGGRFTRPPLTATGINRDLNGTNEMGDFGNEGDHGVTWADLDNDGLLDLVIENSAYPNAHAWIWHQKPDHTFENVTPMSGVQHLMVNSNGLSVADYDRDGDLDILMGSVNTGSQMAPGGVEQVHLFENQVGSINNSIEIALKGVTANRQGIGARITLKAGCLTQTREIVGGKGSFGSADVASAHFGLGNIDRIDEVEVRWPTNPPIVQKFQNLEVNQFLEITEGDDTLTCEARE